VGNATKIRDIVEGTGRRFISDLPGVGENLNNDGYVVVTLKRNQNDSRLTPTDVYAGGEWSSSCRSGGGGSGSSSSSRKHEEGGGRKVVVG